MSGTIKIPKRNWGNTLKEDAQQVDQQNDQQVSQQLNNAQQSNTQALSQKYTNQIIALQQQLAKKEKEYNDKAKEYFDCKSKISQQIILIKKQAAEAGVGPIPDPNESVKVNYDYSKTLYEALTQDSNISILADIIKTTFDKLVGQLSYYFDDKGCLTWAKELNSWLNDNKLNWFRHENHWNDVEEELKRYMTKSKSRFLAGDCSRFISAFKDELINGKSKAVFGWIFGNGNRVTESMIVESFDNEELGRNIEYYGGLKDDTSSYRKKDDARTRAGYDLKQAMYVGYISKNTLEELIDTELIDSVRHRLLFTNDGGAIVVTSKDGIDFNIDDAHRNKLHKRDQAYLSGLSDKERDDLSNLRSIYTTMDRRHRAH